MLPASESKPTSSSFVLVKLGARGISRSSWTNCVLFASKAAFAMLQLTKKPSRKITEIFLIVKIWDSHDSDQKFETRIIFLLRKNLITVIVLPVDWFSLSNFIKLSLIQLRKVFI